MQIVLSLSPQETQKRTEKRCVLCRPIRQFKLLQAQDIYQSELVWTERTKHRRSSCFFLSHQEAVTSFDASALQLAEETTSLCMPSTRQTSTCVSTSSRQTVLSWGQKWKTNQTITRLPSFKYHDDHYDDNDNELYSILKELIIIYFNEYHGD